MKKVIIFLIVFKAFNLFSHEKKYVNVSDLEKYVMPIIDELYQKKKVYYYGNYNFVSKQQNIKVDSFLLKKYGLTKNEWNRYWTACRLNFYRPQEWVKSISIKKKKRLIYSKKKELGELVVLSISTPIFITKSDYLIEITSYCKGICSHTKTYVVHYDVETGKNEIIFKSLISVS